MTGVAAVPPPDFHLVITEHEVGHATVAVHGDLDAASAPALDVVVEGLRAAGHSIAVDLGGVTFADLCGIGPLWVACLYAEPGRVRIVDPAPAVMYLLDVVLELLDDAPGGPPADTDPTYA